MKSWLIAFLWTQLIELPLYQRFLKPLNSRSSFLIGATASTLTHPVVWFVLPRYFQRLGLGPYEVVGLLLVYTIAIEGLWFRAFRVRRPWRAALWVNGIRFLVGMLLSHFELIG